MEDEQDAIENARNHHARGFKTILCVCSAGLLRSPTAAWLLGLPENGGFNTRACGAEKYAVVPLSSALIEWADEIVCMGKPAEHEAIVRDHYYFQFSPKPIFSLGIPDKYAYRDEELVRLIKKALSDLEIMKSAAV